MNMAFSFTGTAFLLITLAFGFLDYRFFQYYRKEMTLFSKYFFYAFFILMLSFLIPAFVGLFFASNYALLMLAIILTTFFQNIFCAVVFYIFLNYIKIDEVIRKIIFILILLAGFAVTYFTAITPIHPSYNNFFIDWDFNPTLGMIRGILLFLALVPLGIIFIKNGLSDKIKERKEKIKTIGLGFSFLAGVIISPLDYFVEKMYSVDVMSSDISIGITAIIIFILVWATQKSPSEQ